MTFPGLPRVADQLFQDLFQSLSPAPGKFSAPSLSAFCDSEGNLDRLRCSYLFGGGAEGARVALARAWQRADPSVTESDLRLSELLDELLGTQVELTGAEVAATVLAWAGVQQVFGYAGTSELALCDAMNRTPGIELVNGRGDKESAFLAAGASMIHPSRGAAILHGARGLTNAAGALADVRRNEVGVVYLVGLPTTSSMRFLPPHGEDRLLETMGAFARWSWEAPPIPGDTASRLPAAVTFVQQLRDALAGATRPPCGPSLFGIPQDVAERRWLPLGALAIAPPAGRAGDTAVDGRAVDALRSARRPLFLIDDYALRIGGARQALDRISRMTGAPVLQLRYRRGPMLFERLQATEVRNFVGWLNQYSFAHRALLEECDLLVTVEDRNIYRRVVGHLPGCRKLALNTDPEKVRKNEYIESQDLLVIGDPVIALNQIADRLQTVAAARQWFSESARDGHAITPEPPSGLVSAGRRAVAGAFAEIFAEMRRPMLVDDSQMFGGILAEHYSDYPEGLRVFGDHGGFVGGGLAYALGLALAEPEAGVVCTLGDQAFTNSFQGLVVAIQQRAKLLVVVCNNGRSVSLCKQAEASLGPARRPHLGNVTGFSYQAVAQAIGVPAERIVISIGAEPETLNQEVAGLLAALRRGSRAGGPALIELVLPAKPEIWRGIWLTQGFEEREAVSISEHTS